jgi:hypothetical protein
MGRSGHDEGICLTLQAQTSIVRKSLSSSSRVRMNPFEAKEALQTGKLGSYWCGCGKSLVNGHGVFNWQTAI